MEPECADTFSQFLVLLVGPIALILIFFARPILTLWLGPRFAGEGALTLQILVVAVLLRSLAYVPYHLLQGVGRPDLPAKFHLAELPAHVGLAWFLTTRFGLPGAALALAVRDMINFLLLLAAACSVTRTSAFMLRKGAGSQRWDSSRAGSRSCSSVGLGPGSHDGGGAHAGPWCRVPLYRLALCS